MCLATFAAAKISGLPSSPTEKVLSGRSIDRPAMAAMIDESNPPDRNEPTSTSATIHFRTASSSVSRSSRHTDSKVKPRLRLRSTMRNAEPSSRAVETVKHLAGSNRFDFERPKPSNAFSSEQNAKPVIQPCDIKRFDAQRIARGDDPLWRGKHKREHAV